MKKDIRDINDISLLVNSFYDKVFMDETLGYIFKNTPGFSFDKHILVMISFWDTLLFGTLNYKGSPMIKHMDLNKNFPLKSQHFDQWLTLWEATINENFEGNFASGAILKAKNVAGILQHKISSNTDK